MKKIAIIGISGTGKSFFGKRLAPMTGLPLYHMDALIWGPDWTENDEDFVGAELSQITAQESWIVEGWIDVYSKDMLRSAEVIIYLDYPGWLSAFGGLSRWWTHKGKQRPELAAGCMETFNIQSLQKMLRRLERPHIEAILKQASTNNVVRFYSRQQTEKFVSDLLEEVHDSARPRQVF